ncbi:Rat1 Interacting Protein 1 [Carabus blaptoides fortunei]
MSYYEKVVRIYGNAIEEIDPKNTASFEKPSVCGYFSIDSDRKYVSDMSNLMYYYPRFKESENHRLELDLNVGMKNVVRKPEELNEKLDHMLYFLLTNANKLINTDNPNKLLNTDFVCFRGLLTQIMCSLHLREDWTICATKWKDTIYLCAADSKQTYNIPKDEQNKFCSWGYKFEQYMLTKKPEVPPDTSKPVHESEEFCCVFKSKLNSHSLIYGAEMDGILSNKEINESDPNWDTIEFIELKTSKKVIRINQDRTLKMFKFIKWWAQSYLVNVKQVHCGFRDRNGIVTEILPFNVKDLPRLSGNCWNWRSCLNFCDIFLKIVKDTIPENTDDPHIVWKFEWKQNLQHFKIDEVKGENTYSFLPKWYIDNMKNVVNNL